MSSNGYNIGGLAGRNSGTISDTYATGAVKLDNSSININTAGGLVGWNHGGSITNSYATGAVSATTANTPSVGGLVGNNQDFIPGDGEGRVPATVTGSYWDTTTSGQSGSDGGTGQTTTELQAPTANTGIYDGWNADRWDFGTTEEYPALKADHDNDGRATWPEFGLQRAPGPVTDLAAARDANDHIVVTWGAPESPGSGVFETYQYRVSTDGGTNWGDWTDTSDTSHTFTPLVNTGYTVAARAVNLVTRGNMEIQSDGAESRIGPPGAPTALTLLAYETSLGVSWSAPANAEGITGYSVNTARPHTAPTGSTRTKRSARTTAEPGQSSPSARPRLSAPTRPTRTKRHARATTKPGQSSTAPGPTTPRPPPTSWRQRSPTFTPTPSTRYVWRQPTPWASAHTCMARPRRARRRALPACPATCGSCLRSADCS